MNVLNEVYTIKEASELWGIHTSTITKLITTTDKLLSGIDYKKSGSTWLITKEAMRNVYGKQKEQIKRR